MKVFLSWSGDRSHKVALALKGWLPSVIQSIKPYVSSEDIYKGARWSTDIANELKDSTFGILCVTKDNFEAPWLLFEAGALSGTIDKSLVCPFLFDVKTSEVNGPILQFQSTVFEKEDVRKLILTLNKACRETPLEEDLLNRSFDMWWPDLEKTLNGIASDKDTPVEPEHVQDTSLSMAILEEILELSRTNQKILRSPDAILPPEYLNHVLDKVHDNDSIGKMSRLSINIRREYFRLMDILEVYRRDGRSIDDELNMAIKGFTDLVGRQQAIIQYYTKNSRFR